LTAWQLISKYVLQALSIDFFFVGEIFFVGEKKRRIKEYKNEKP